MLLKLLKAVEKMILLQSIRPMFWRHPDLWRTVVKEVVAKALPNGQTVQSYVCR
jgi:hypothetical protein